MPQTYTVGARSLFVTITAWVFVALGALATVSAVVHSAALAPWMPQALAEAVPVQPLPWLSGLLMAYLPWVVGAGVTVALATLTAAIGLLQRLEWARRCFIGLLVLAIAANLLGLWLQQEVLQSVVDATLQRAALPPQAADMFGGVVTTARALAVVVTLGACALLAWIIRRLSTPRVRQEFA